MNINPLEITVTVIAAVMIMSPLLLAAYQAGRGTSTTGKSHRFNHVIADVHLNDTWWRAEFGADEETSTPVVLRLHLRQMGARVFGEGVSASGIRHSFEGVMHGRLLCYVVLEEQQRVEWPGSVVAEVQPGDATILGIRTRWVGQRQTMLMRPAMFTRLNGPDSQLEQVVKA
jgi:hypothetical protein